MVNDVAEKTTKIQQLSSQMATIKEQLSEKTKQLTEKQGKIKELEKQIIDGTKKKKGLISGITIGVIATLIIWFGVSYLNKDENKGANTTEYYVTEQQCITDTLSFTYTGQMLKGTPNGIGKAIYADGHFEGVFESGYRLYGTRYFNNGATYTGSYKHEQANGYGTFQYEDGTKYVGEFVNDKLEGLGTYYDGQGKVVAKGKFENGELIKQTQQ